MIKKSNTSLLFFLTIWTILMILFVTWGTRYDWPDNVHVDYGFPITWSTQTLSTIVGSVNVWTVDILALILNLILWLGILLIIAAISLYFFNKKSL
jgi:hypothetical protein